MKQHDSVTTAKIAAIVSAIAVLVAATGEAAKRRAVRGPGPPPPQIDSVVPLSGPISGGIEVVLQGQHLHDAILTIDGVELQPLVRTFDRISFTAPPRVNGYASIAVTTPSGRSAREFLYVPPALGSLPSGHITTVAGIGDYVADGRPAKEVPIYAQDFALAADGTVYIAENNANVVRRILPNGIIERFAGNGSSVGAFAGDGGPALQASLSYPNDVEIGPEGAIYICDSFNHRVRRVDAHTGVITTIAGSGPNANCCSGSYGGDGGAATLAKLNAPTQIAFDSRRNLYILDGHNARIRRVSPDGVITTIAGNGVRGFSGDGGPATEAQIDPGVGGDDGSMKIDRSGNIYFTSPPYVRIRRIDAVTGIIRTVVGGIGSGSDEGAPASETAGGYGIALDGAGQLYFSDPTRIRRVDADGRVRTVLGSATPGDVSFSEDGTPLSLTRLFDPGRIDIDARGNIYFQTFLFSRLRRTDVATQTVQTVAGIAPKEFGEGGPAVEAQLYALGPKVLVNGELIFGNKYVFLLRLGRDGILRRIAGSPFPSPESPRPGVPRDPLKGNVPTSGIAVDASGTIYLADREIAKITTDGRYIPLTRNGRGFAGDGGPASEALLDNATSLALDSKANLFIADTYNHRIRRIDASTGVITTVAGNAPPHPPDVLVPEPSTGDGGPAKDGRINAPDSIAIDAQDRLYLADTDRIRRIDADGIIRTVLPACFGPLTANRRGEVFVACNSEIRRIDGLNQWTLLARISPGPVAGDGGPASEAQGGIGNIAVDDDGTVYFNERDGRRIRAIRGLGH